MLSSSLVLAWLKGKARASAQLYMLSCHIGNTTKGSPLPPLSFCRFWQESQSACTRHAQGVWDLFPCSWSRSSRGIMGSPGPFLFASLSPLASFPISGERSRGYKRPGVDYERQRLPRKWTTVLIPDHPGQRWEGFWCHPKWSAGDIIHPEQKNKRTVPTTSPGRACLPVLNSPARLSSNKMRLGWHRWMEISLALEKSNPGTNYAVWSQVQRSFLHTVCPQEAGRQLIKSDNMIMRNTLSTVSLDRCISQHHSSDFQFKPRPGSGPTNFLQVSLSFKKWFKFLFKEDFYCCRVN